MYFVSIIFPINNSITFAPPIKSYWNFCPGGGIGRHAGLKILWPYSCTGSTPVPGTKHSEEQSESAVPRYVLLRTHTRSKVSIRVMFLR